MKRKIAAMAHLILDTDFPILKRDGIALLDFSDGDLTRDQQLDILTWMEKAGYLWSRQFAHLEDHWNMLEQEAAR